MSYQRRKLLHALLRLGCTFLREGGRHTVLRAPSGARVEVPRHGEVKRGTARNIARQAGVPWETLEELIA